MYSKSFLRRFFFFVLFIGLIYGAGRLYFHLTAGFSLENISSDLTYQPQWQVPEPSEKENGEINQALAQPYYYLGKGCQSYVFLSQNGSYVMKFFKYQRFRIAPWLRYFPPLPAIVAYRKEKEKEKWQRLNAFATSLTIAAKRLKKESGLVYLHLNKTDHLNKKVVIEDKIGRVYTLDIDQMEFSIQKRADLLCDVLSNYQKQGQVKESYQLIDRLLALLVSEYRRGLADNDHALMQNTGVVDKEPIHIDVGRFEELEEVKNPAKYHQELFTKCYHFHQWLKVNDPAVSLYLEKKLKEIIGPKYHIMKPIWYEKPARDALL